MVRKSVGERLVVLKDILVEQGIPDTWYFIGNYSEDCICLECEDDGFVVYNAIRGQKKFLSNHKEIKEAVDAFLSRLVRDKARAQKISEEFAKRIDE